MNRGKPIRGIFQGGDFLNLLEYYYKTEDKLGPAVSYILLGILALLLIGITIYNRRQDKKKRGRF
jgi:hypothetical protein